MPRETGASQGTLVDTLHYRFRGVESGSGNLSVSEGSTDDECMKPLVIDKIVAVEVRMRKKFLAEENGSKRTVSSVGFTLVCENPSFAVSGTDIEALRVAAWDFLDKELAVKWERYFLVRVEPPSWLGAPGAGLQFLYESIERGVAHDGTLLMRKWNSNAYKRYEVSPWPGEFKNQNGKVMACIPATEANKASMEQFSSMVDELRRKLSEYFRPDKIQETLANLSGMQMLGSSSETVDEGASVDH